METSEAHQPLPEALFVDEEILSVPSAADRYGYKKTSGSSDTKQTQDIFD